MCVPLIPRTAAAALDKRRTAIWRETLASGPLTDARRFLLLFFFFYFSILNIFFFPPSRNRKTTGDACHSPKSAESRRPRPADATTLLTRLHAIIIHFTLARINVGFIRTSHLEVYYKTRGYVIERDHNAEDGSPESIY